MSTTHQAIQEWHASALAAERRASLYEPGMRSLGDDGRGRCGDPGSLVAAEVAALNATLCGLGALLCEAAAALHVLASGASEASYLEERS